MLPSTGYFKGNNCPFYDNGLCERPYCHFRHVKKESLSTQNDGIESGAILQKLVSAAVQKVLQHTEASTAAASTELENNDKSLVPGVPKVTYNPTPISELNKITNPEIEGNEEATEQRRRHIPVPYTPRKPASLSIQRPNDTNGSSKPFIYIPPPLKYTPGSSEAVQCDKYTPTGSTLSTETYLPGTETELQEYNPNEGSKTTSSNRNYVPSDKSVNKKKILEYKPTKLSTKTETQTVTYQPTPRALAPCFSSDEDEPDIKKQKLSADLNGLDDLGPEFDILDQILDEEKPDKVKKVSLLSEAKESNHKNSHRSKENRKEKSSSDKNHNSSKSHKKSSSDKKDKSSKSDDSSNGKHERKNSELKSKHKSSNREKESKDKKDKQSSDKKSSDRKTHSTSKESDSSSKHSKHSSSKRHDSKEKSDRKAHKSSKESNNKQKTSEIISNFSDDDDAPDEELIDEELDLESDEEAIAMECKRIFDEYVPVEKPKFVEEVVKQEESLEEESIPGKKRISRAIDKNVKITSKAPIKPDFKVSAAQQMAERLAKVREYHTARNTNELTKPDPAPISKNSLVPPPTGHSKIRIAHVPYASNLVNVKKAITPNHNTVKSEPSTSTTITQTVKKGAQRVAHVPNEKFIDRPGVLAPLGSKIPANIRSKYLNLMIDECLKIYLTPTDAYARAQHEELNTSKKCSTVQIYKNSAVLTISRLRKEFLECNGVKKSGSDCTTLQKVPGLTPTTTSSWSIVNNSRKNIDNSKEFRGAKLYSNLQKWILTEEQLKENGFPRPHESGKRGRAIIYGQNKKPPPKGLTRNCGRCKKDYNVDKKGFAVVKEECIYHPNNKYRFRGEVRYQCCSQDGSSDGCCVAPSHVYEYVDFDNLKGFVRTLPPENTHDDYGIYALDCEMCYTTQGLDLTRVTIINSDCKVVYETLIKPLHPIIDFNTRYSGITEEQMVNVTTSLLDVQATLLTMFNSKTILVGHSLESDFKVLKLIHDTVIDTSVLFPHKMGPPYKRALRNLSSEYLKKIIQNSVDGHDSAEDATVCMELLHFKLKEELKTR